MSFSNSSFEHVLHSLQARESLIGDLNSMIGQLLQHIKSTSSARSVPPYALGKISERVDSLFGQYRASMDRFNLEVISFISEYYAIVDQHADQFHSKYLHNYSGHSGHYNPILSLYPSNKFNIEDLVNIFKEHCYSFKRFKFYTDSSHVRRSRERTWVIYQSLANYIASENVYDLSTALIAEFSAIANEMERLVKSSANELLSSIKCAIQKVTSGKLEFTATEEILDYCECGNIMQVMNGSSEILCDHCGFIFELKGTVFDDSQFYSQESTRYKHAGYEPSKHAKCWLERIQARESNTISDAHIDKIESCIRRDGITNKKRITVEQLRRYLKDTGLTELNEHVALIKRTITGVVPPQLTYAETQDITNSFTKAVKAYNIIRPSNKSNFLFYPYLLRKLIEMHVSDFGKRRDLLAFIHLQGSQTLVQNDQIWMQMCKVVPTFVFRPTDRYEYGE